MGDGIDGGTGGGVSSSPEVMQARVHEIPRGASLNEIFEIRRRAQQTQRVAEAAIKDTLREYQAAQTPVRIAGYPFTVTMAWHDDAGKVTQHTELMVSADAEKPKIREFTGTVTGIRDNIVEVTPQGADNSWNYLLNGVVGIEAVLPIQDPGLQE